MTNKRLISIFLVTFIALLLSWSETATASPNVSECIGENKDCENMEQNDTGRTAEGKDAAEGVSTGSLIFNLVKMVFALLLVLGLIYLLLKFLNKRNKLFQQVKALENLGGISVGPNKSVQLVRIGSKVFVIGVGENVELLQEVDEELKNELLHNGGTEQMEPKAIVKSVFPQLKNAAATNKSGQEFKNLFSSELNKLKHSRDKLINRKKEDSDE